MIWLSPPGIMTPIGDVPIVVFVAAFAGICVLVVALFLPLFRRLRMQQRIRDLPPPPVKQEIEPDLKLPRRGGGA